MSESFILVLGVISVWVMILLVLGFAPVEPSPVKRYPLIVLYAAILHYVWAVSVALDPRAGEATSLAGLAWLLGRSFQRLSPCLTCRYLAADRPGKGRVECKGNFAIVRARPRLIFEMEGTPSHNHALSCGRGPRLIPG